MYPKLNLPETKVKLQDDKVWCRLRKKYLKSTPEEWVRQNFINYLIDSKHYPEGRLVSEYLVNYNGMKKRCDLALFDEVLKVDVIVECKAPKIKITEDTFYQIAKYSKVLQAKYLILTNGLEHYCAFIDVAKNELRYLKEIPDYQEICDTLKP